MKRRDFINQATGALLATPLVGCSRSEQAADKKPSSDKSYRWKMVTCWPKNYPGLGTSAERIAAHINNMSNGRLEVTVYGAGELVSAFEVFDTVRSGAVAMGHSAAYYWQGKNRAFNFFGSVPFGMNIVEMIAWFNHGGGQELWDEGYGEFGLIPIAVGGTGIQMGGWFNREINSVEDLKGIKIRIPGLASQIYERLGMVPVNLPGGELFTALQTGMLDAVEWSTPYNDLTFGFYKIADYYYYPGWQEPGVVIECLLNKDMFMELPDDLQAIVRNACEAESMRLLTEYLALNPDSLRILQDKHGVQLRRFPDKVIDKLREVADDVLAEVASESDYAQRVYRSFNDFLGKMKMWAQYSEKMLYDIRAPQ